EFRSPEPLPWSRQPKENSRTRADWLSQNFCRRFMSGLGLPCSEVEIAPSSNCGGIFVREPRTGAPQLLDQEVDEASDAHRRVTCTEEHGVDALKLTGMEVFKQRDQTALAHVLSHLKPAQPGYSGAGHRHMP